MAKSKGPTSYTQWVDALECPLTAENAEYMRNGSFKHGKLYAELFNRISDYVVNVFDAEAGKIGVSGDVADTVYALTRFNAVCKRLTFFRAPKFIKKCDADRLADALKASAARLVEKLSSGAENNVELAYAIGVVKRTAEAI